MIVKTLDGDKLSHKHALEIIELSKNVDAVLLGPGSGIDEDTSKLFNILVSKIKKPIVLDADSLKQIDISLVKNRKDIILTPHLFEFKTFFNVSCDLKLDIDSDDFRAVSENIREFQQITRQIEGCVIVKGKNDLVLSSNRFRINKTGNAGMTVGGTGDALAGIISGLIAQDLAPFDAACLGVFINGLAGDRAYEDYGYNFSATDVVSHIAGVMKNGLC